MKKKILVLTWPLLLLLLIILIITIITILRSKIIG